MCCSISLQGSNCGPRAGYSSAMQEPRVWLPSSSLSRQVVWAPFQLDPPTEVGNVCLVKTQNSFRCRSPDVRDLWKTEQQKGGLTKSTLGHPKALGGTCFLTCPSRYPKRKPSTTIFSADSSPRRMSGKAQDGPLDILFRVVRVASEGTHSQFPVNGEEQSPYSDSS